MPRTIMLLGPLVLAGCASTPVSPAPPPVPPPAPGDEPEVEPPGPPPAVLAAPPVVLTKDDFRLEGKRGPFRADWTVEEVAPGLLMVHLELSAKTAAVPPPVTLTWSTPSVDLDGYWNPNVGMDKVSYGGNRVTSRVTTNAPVFALVSGSDRNRMTVAVSDALNRVELSSHLREEDAQVYVEAQFFTERTPPAERHAVDIRVDLRPVTFVRALRDTVLWWASQDEYAPAPVPESARLPMYSTRYNFHQDLVVADVLAELKLARELGYDAVIVDDGWQTTDSNRGYAYAGDWSAERIGDMKGFVDQVHGLGMKFILWYSLPLVGGKAKLQKKFRGKYLRYSKSLGAYTLDPRYPEVREYIIGTYETALGQWGLDGFKLDFMDRFVAERNTRLTKAGGRDYASVNEAVDRLMTDVMHRLRAIKPDIMIEFRQAYIGPLMRKYGNMFRAMDCPNNAVVNRSRVVDLRLLSGNTAVHSDMLMWHLEEPVEHAALQILNVLFSVPQLSVRLRELPPDHLEMVRFWTGYWRENRDVLLDGAFRPVSPAGGYPLVVGATTQKTIVAVYADRVVDVGNDPSNIIDLINGKHSSTVVIRAPTGLGKRRLTVFDTTGEKVDSVKAFYEPGVHEIHVPPSGLARIQVR